jgi:hypothetical protein
MLPSQGSCYEKTDLMFHLSKIDDPRTGKNYRHKFIEILFIGICAVISGCEYWTEIEDYAQTKQDWFLSFLELKNGIPSHDTFRRVFCILDFTVFQKMFISWTAEIKNKSSRTLLITHKFDQACPVVFKL